MTATKKPANALKSPPVAWPTIALTLLVILTWGGSALAFAADLMPWWGTLIVSSLAAFAAFTPTHDASHKSIARTPWVNAVIGRLCGLILTAPFPAFRDLHLRHHKHTNHDHEDPDLWSGRGPKLLLPLRWLTQDLHYYWFYLRRWREHDTKEKWETVALLSLVALVATGLSVAGYGALVLFAWILPARVGIMALAYGFDYLPHAPHQTTSKENRFAATILRPSALLTPVLLYQNYHLVHHLYPGVPFYRYVKVWKQQRTKLVPKGVQAKDLLGRPMTQESLLQEPPQAPTTKAQPTVG